MQSGAVAEFTKHYTPPAHTLLASPRPPATAHVHPKKQKTDRVHVCVVFFDSSAFQLNEVRAQIVDANQRLTAASALLFAKQAAALSLQREIKEKEQQVRAALHVQIHPFFSL